MSDVRIYRPGIIGPDDGSDGNFWRKGERWLREHGEEHRYVDLAPHLEPQYILELDLSDGTCDQSIARQKSLEDYPMLQKLLIDGLERKLREVRAEVEGLETALAKARALP